MVARRAEQIYERQIKELPPEEQLHLLTLVAEGLAARERSKHRKKRSILELEGLGAEIWEGIDPQKYIDELRDEWDRRP